MSTTSTTQSNFTPGSGVSLREIPQATLLRDLYGEKVFLKDVYGQSILTTDKNYVESTADIIRRLHVAKYLLDHLQVDLLEDHWVFYMASFIESSLNVPQSSSIVNYKQVERIQREKNTMKGNLIIMDSELNEATTQTKVDEAGIKIDDSIVFLRLMQIVENFLNTLQFNVVKLNMAQLINVQNELKRLKAFFGIDKYLSMEDLENKNAEMQMEAEAFVEEDDNEEEEDQNIQYNAKLRNSVHFGIRPANYNNAPSQKINCETIVGGVRKVAPVSINVPKPLPAMKPNPNEKSLNELLGNEGTIEPILRNVNQPSDDLIWRLEQTSEEIKDDEFVWTLSYSRKHIPSFIFSSLRTLIEQLEKAQEDQTVTGDSIMKKVDDIKKEFVGIGKMVFARLDFLRGVDLNLYIEQPVLADKYRSAIDIGYKQMVDVAREFNCYLLPELERQKDATTFLSQHWMMEPIFAKRKAIDVVKSNIRVSFKKKLKLSTELQILKDKKAKNDLYHLQSATTLSDDIAAKQTDLDAILASLDAAYEERKKLVQELQNMNKEHVQNKIAMKLFLNYISEFYVEKHQLNIIMNGDNARASRGGIVGSELYVNPKNMNTINMESSYRALQNFYIAFGETILPNIPAKPLINSTSCFKRLKLT